MCGRSNQRRAAATVELALLLPLLMFLFVVALDYAESSTIPKFWRTVPGVVLCMPAILIRR
ncbi:MAG: hypothetical protein RMJ19_01820 [Gemmatales bacterium]|nr:hypothetical protein [Gemmatales bacterium]MDW8174383.1 hypothetical protein [Gemmatales bacterium]